MIEPMSQEARIRIMERRLGEAKAQGRTISKKVKCRLCDDTFNNPFYDGSNITTVVCGTCRKNMSGKFGRRVKRKVTRDPVKASQPTTPSDTWNESRTLKRVELLLKDYLHDMNRGWLL